MSSGCSLAMRVQTRMIVSMVSTHPACSSRSGSLSPLPRFAHPTKTRLLVPLLVLSYVVLSRYIQQSLLVSPVN
ncbi:hypothetical protein Hanom_Chr11g00995981 [Helianthus anomalus]